MFSALPGFYVMLGNQTQDFTVAQQTLYLLPYLIVLVGQDPDP